MRELDTLNASTLVESGHLFLQPGLSRKSLTLQLLPNTHCDIDRASISTKDLPIVDTQLSLDAPRIEDIQSSLHPYSTQAVETSARPSRSQSVSVASTPVMIEIPSPAKFLVHPHSSTELDPLDFKDDSGSSSSDEDVFLPDCTDPTIVGSSSPVTTSWPHEPKKYPVHCSSWKWNRASILYPVRSLTHHSYGGFPNTSTAQRSPISQSEKPNTGWGVSSSNAHVTKSSSISYSAEYCHSFSEPQPEENRSSSPVYVSVESNSQVTPKVPTARVPITSDSTSTSVSACDSEPRNMNSQLHLKQQPNDSKKNLCSTYSLHVERLKLLSAFCALRSPGFSEDIINKLYTDQNIASPSYPSVPARAVNLPWSVQRCELKWLLCILISAPMNSMRNLSQLIQRISPSLELTTKLRLPWHTAGHTSTRKLPANHRYQSEFDPEREGITRTSRHCVHDDVCSLPGSHRPSSTKCRVSRASSKLSDSQNKITHHLIAHNCKSACIDDKDRKTYAAVAAAAALPIASPVITTSQGSWLTPAEAAIHGKHHQRNHDCCTSGSSGGSSSDRSSTARNVSENSSVHVLTPVSPNIACSTSPKVSVVSARTTKEQLGGARNSPSSRSSSWIIPPTSSSHRSSYLTRPIPMHPRVVNPFAMRSQLYPSPSGVSCPTYPLSYNNAYTYPTTYDFTPRKAKSYGECCSSSTYSDDVRPVDEPGSSTPGDTVPGVFVDLTGYDVTVSVERLPPITDGPIQSRRSGRRSIPDDIPSQGNPPSAIPSYPVCNAYQPLNEHRYSLPMTLPVSPPPPYSECSYSNSVSSSSNSAFFPIPYPDIPWRFPVNHTAAHVHHLNGKRTPSTPPPPPHSRLSHSETQPWIVPSPVAPINSYTTMKMCPCHCAHFPFRWVTSKPFSPFRFCPCSLPAIPQHMRTCCSHYCPARRHFYSTTTAYSSPHEQISVVDNLEHSLGFVIDDGRQRATFQRQISCPEDPLSLVGSKHNGTTSERVTNNNPLDLRCNPELTTFPFHLNEISQENSNRWVYVPEPIRVPRSQDVYNALRTCLVPYYELRDYIHNAPPPRQWRRLEEPSKDGFSFTLMCYNLLSPSYATQNMYPYCPSWALKWDYRRRAILDEICAYHANIICLQEVETNQFEEIFKPELEKLNYDAVFLPKSRCRTMDMKDCKKVDGCAIFWQVDKFEKLHEFHHEFMFSCSNMCENPSPLIVNRVMTRDNVALGVIFETKGAPGPDGPGGRQFCVTTGHIHWDPELSDVKMIQTILWTAELWAYIDQFLTGSGDTKDRESPTSTRNTPLSNRIPVPGPSSPAANMPVVLCGDLNSLPESGVVEFLMRGSLPKSHTDFLNNGFKYMFEDWRLLEKWAVDGDTLRHRFTFDRAYREDQGMQLTNFTYEFKGMIDYVLFSRQHFRLLKSLDQLHESWFAEKKIVGCPHVHIPSDHFSLVVELELKPTPQLASLVAARGSARSRCRSEGGVSLENGQSKSGPRGGSSLGCSPHSTGIAAMNCADHADAGASETGTDAAFCPSTGHGKHRKR